MPEAAVAPKAANPNAVTGVVKDKAPKAPKAPKEPKDSNRTNFSKLWPEDAKLAVLVDKNVKKAGSKAAERFEFYFKAKTVGDFLAAGGTYQDIAYDSARQFIKVG
jgi:hypothetical protein